MEPVRKTLARKACTLIDPDAWVIDDTGFLKDGDASACVARQYSGTLSEVGNCQIAVSVNAVSDRASAPLDWRLYVPERWDDRCAADPADAAAVALRLRDWCGGGADLRGVGGRAGDVCDGPVMALTG